MLEPERQLSYHRRYVRPKGLGNGRPGPDLDVGVRNAQRSADGLHREPSFGHDSDRKRCFLGPLSPRASLRISRFHRLLAPQLMQLGLLSWSGSHRQKLRDFEQIPVARGQSSNPLTVSAVLKHQLKVEKNLLHVKIITAIPLATDIFSQPVVPTMERHDAARPILHDNTATVL